jgi:uncharacterized protein (TIGR02611 family)
MSRGLHSPYAWVRLIATNLRRLIVLVLGAGVLGAGVAMLVLPGPGVLVIFIGLAILATEFAWAERTLDRTKARATDATLRLTANSFSRLVFGLMGSALVVGGGVAAVLADEYRYVGFAMIFAGVCALIVLVPRVRRWIASAGTTPID